MKTIMLLLWIALHRRHHLCPLLAVMRNLVLEAHLTIRQLYLGQEQRQMRYTGHQVYAYLWGIMLNS